MGEPVSALRRRPEHLIPSSITAVQYIFILIIKICKVHYFWLTRHLVNV